MDSDRTLSELCSLIVDSEHKTAPKDPDGAHPLVRTTNLGRAHVEYAAAQRVNGEVYLGWTRRARPQNGDLILAREAPVGGIGLVPEGIHPVLGQRTVLLRPSAEVDSRFLMYRLAAPDMQARMLEMATGATVPHLNMADIRVLGVPDVPTRHDQRRRGATLAACDDLIAINERRIEVLEDLARSLYREWFVRFRFPGHGDVPTPEDRSRYVPPGWREIALGDLAEVVNDGISPTDVDPGSPYCGLEHLPRGATTLREWATADSVTSRKHRFQAADTLFGKIRPYFHKVVWAPISGIASSDAIVFRTRPDCPVPALVNAVLSSDSLVAEAVATSNGTKMPRADAGAILRYRLVLPPPGDGLVSQAEAALRAACDDCAALVRQSFALARTRDLLLPRLVTGRLDISDVDLGDLLPDEKVA